MLSNSFAEKSARNVPEPESPLPATCLVAPLVSLPVAQSSSSFPGCLQTSFRRLLTSLSLSAKDIPLDRQECVLRWQCPGGRGNSLYQCLAQLDSLVWVFADISFTEDRPGEWGAEEICHSCLYCSLSLSGKTGWHLHNLAWRPF